MDMLKDEVVAIAEVTDVANDEQMCELNELQLALVGGGVGDVIIV